MILPSEKSATDVAAQCFLNALIRETKDWQLAEYPPDELIIPLDEQKSLHFRVAYFSPTQHHRFAFPAHLVTASGSYPVDFTTLSRLIIDKRSPRYHCATGRPRMGRCLLSAGAEASVYG